MQDHSPNGTDPSDDDTGTAFERFERLTRNLVRVPKAEIDMQRKKAERAKIARRRST